MPALQCNVNSCSSNSSGYCCRPSIHVSGETAHNSSDTSCRSFSERTNHISNDVQYNSPNQSLSISCDARRCTFNQNNNCNANSISVSYGFSGTECASFRQY